MSYYQIWLHSQEELLTAYGYISAEEMAEAHSLKEPAAVEHILRPAEVLAAVTEPGSYIRKPQAPAAFAVGDRVRTRNMHPTGHTRLPRYARGKLGTIERINGPHVFPDSNARGRGEDPQWCYSVRIAGAELWGPDADPTLSVSLDLFEPYLERA
jgi:nitrile hydratase